MAAGSVDAKAARVSSKAKKSGLTGASKPALVRHEHCNGLVYDQGRGEFDNGKLSGFVTLWFNDGSEYEGPLVPHCPLRVERAPPLWRRREKRRLGLMRRAEHG